MPRLFVLCAAAVLALVLPASAGAALPVPYSLAAGVAAEALHPGAAPPGSNDFACKPTAAHPDPVVLVHGLVGNMTDNWPTMSPLLKNSGYCVFALTYGTAPGVGFPLDQVGGLGPMELSAQALSAFVDRVRTATGAAEVDIVGHSEGTVISAYYARFLGGAAKIDRFVGIAGVYHGTNLAGLARLEPLARQLGVTAPFDSLCQACVQLLDNSPFMAKLNSGPGGAAVAGVTYTNIVTRYDELVAPYTNGTLNAPNATNIVVQARCMLDFSDHFAIVAERNTARYMRRTPLPWRASRSCPWSARSLSKKSTDSRRDQSVAGARRARAHAKPPANVTNRPSVAETMITMTPLSSEPSCGTPSPLVATAETTAVTTAPPTCSDVLSRPDASPCSASATPATAWMFSAGKPTAKPTPASRTVGRIARM